MKLEMTGQMRMEQRMKLAPHMIQSMEILQLPILALQERIEQELNNNPVLELEEPAETEPSEQTDSEQEDDSEKDLVVDPDNNTPEEFQRLNNLDDGFKESIEQAGPFRRSSSSDEADPKLEAIKNTAAPPMSLHEHLTEQWRLVEAEEPVKKAGSTIIDYINDRGYLTVRLEQLHNKDNPDFTIEHLKKALDLVQQLEPLGVGAHDLRECLLIQLAQSREDFQFEYQLVSEHFNDLLENHLPDIAKKMNTSVETISQAIARLSKLDTSPGLQVSQAVNHIIIPDVIVEPIENEGYSVRLADSNTPNLKLSNYYTKMAKDSRVSDKTRKFLQDNFRSAQWIIDAIEQRKNTLLKVATAIVKYQKNFFDKGPLQLEPLPMSKIADDVGVHIATVSRAVSGKYMQCPWGVLPLRKFFSGGTEDSHGKAVSWEAIRVKLQKIIDDEDKTKPLSDDQIREKLIQAGIPNIARRTVAKYRNLLNIPTAKMRKKY